MEYPRWYIDFEASGIAPDSYPIEVAVVSSEAAYHSLIRPVYYWTHWSWDAQDMHGIPRESLVADGREPAQIAVKLNAVFLGARLCCDSPQDGFWLDTLFEAAGIECSFTVLPLESFVGRSTADEIYRMTPAKRSHRALPDATSLMAATLKYASKAR